MTTTAKQLLQSSGHLIISGEAIRVMVSHDFVYLYKKFVDDHFNMLTNFPAHKAHITLTNNKLHPWFFKKLDMEKLDFLRHHFARNPIEFEYDPDIRVGGKTKNFRNFYLKVQSEKIDRILQLLNIPPPPNGLHITVANTKGGVRPHFGRMIEIREPATP